MPVGDKKDSLVSFVGDAGEGSPRLIKREKFDGFGATCACDYTLWRLGCGDFPLVGLLGFLLSGDNWHGVRLAYWSIRLF